MGVGVAMCAPRLGEGYLSNLVNQKSTTSISLQCISGQVNQMAEYHWNTHIPELNCIQMKEAPSTRSSEMVRTAGFEPTIHFSPQNANKLIGIVHK